MLKEQRLDLIDRNALLAELDKFANPMPNNSGYEFLRGIATAITEIEDSPMVDAVKVIRCRDCKYFSRDKQYNRAWCNYYGGCIEVAVNGYCYHGAQMDGGSNNE